MRNEKLKKPRKSKIRNSVKPPVIGVKSEPCDEVYLVDMAHGEVGVTEEGLYYLRTPTTLTCLNMPSETYTMDNDEEIPKDRVQVFSPGTVLELKVNISRPWSDEDDEDGC
jgi:hypothetical protein